MCKSTAITAARRKPVADPVAAELARLAGAIDALAAGLIEVREDVRELRARMPPADAGPPQDALRRRHERLVKVLVWAVRANRACSNSIRSLGCGVGSVSGDHG